MDLRNPRFWVQTERAKGNAAMKTVYLTLYLETLLAREVLPGIVRYARAHGGWNFQAFNRLPGDGVTLDGVLGILVEKRHRPQIDALRARGIPIVGLSGFDPPAGIPTVAHDNKAVGAMAANHLLEKGYRRFAYIHLPAAANSADRLKGFRDRLKERGQPPPEVWSAESNELRERLRKTAKPVGVFAFNDHQAREAESACLDAGVSIPSELGLLGVDNNAIECELCPVPLSSIAMRFDQTGWEAARMLDALMRGEDPEAPPPLKPLRVAARLSTDPLRVEDALVRRALARMNATMGAWAGVEALARELGVSKRALELRFREATGQSIHQRLQQMRVEEAIRLFREERTSVTETAARVGVTDVNRFGLLFRQLTGRTPSSFRKLAEHSKPARPNT